MFENGQFFKCSVLSSDDPDFQRIQGIIHMHVRKYNANPVLLEKLKNIA